MKKSQLLDLKAEVKKTDRHDDDFIKIKMKQASPSQKISSSKVAFPMVLERFYSGKISKEHINSSKFRALKNYDFECNKSSFKSPNLNIATSSVNSGSQ